ncbi:MAG: type II toxin-antitoxin system VapC family toxin [Mariniphaga sp.]|nr:type II toxin-antitoxin system VapC family toxin [Mariniphaga sp.]
MGTRYLIDSNTVIDYIAGLHPEKALKWLNQIIDEEINVSVITKIEVLSYNPDIEDNYQILIEFFESTAVFSLTEEIVDRTICLRQKQKIKLPDAVIAATALVNELTLISRNTKDFKNIKGLEIVDPYKI